MKFMEARLVIEYSDFFVGDDPVDGKSTLKMFDRKELIRMAALLSLQYGNLQYPDDEHTLFSDISAKYIPTLNNLFEAYYVRQNLEPGSIVQISTFRTALELWRLIFSIHVEEFKNAVEPEDIELLLFKVILTINERIVYFNGDVDEFEPDEFIFLNQFLNNDSNNYDYKVVMTAQMYYFNRLVEFIPKNDVLKQAQNILFEKWGITDWKQYYGTILWLTYRTNEYKEQLQKGVPIIPIEKLMNEDKTGILSKTLLENLSIKEDEYIPDEDADVERNEKNIDYRIFRGKPLVRFNNGEYVIINNQFLCERLYNSLYFDFQPLINGKEGSVGFFDYNKGFTEKTLFRHTLIPCLSHVACSFPPVYRYKMKEESSEPDYYVRTKSGEIIIVECKAIKMNGEYRDKGDYKELLCNLQEKIVRKTRNLDSSRRIAKGGPKPIGVGQLINHIESIEEDTFKWDNSIPDKVIYYPILVFEDIRLLRPGLLSMVNRWFYEEIKKRKTIVLNETSCMPVMVLSINTLYLYDGFIKRNGLVNLINRFLECEAIHDEKTGEYVFKNVCASFDDYIRTNPFSKSREANRLVKKLRMQS